MNFNGIVIGGRLNLRSAPSTGSSSAVQIPNGTTLTVSLVNGNREWFQTSYNGYYGYVLSRFVAISNDGGTCIVTTNSGSLNIRKTNSGTSTILFTAPKGATLRLLEYNTVAGWYRVSNSSGTGWASSDFLTITSYPNSNGGSNYGQAAVVDTNKHGNGGTLNLRASDSGTAAVVAVIPNGSTIYVTSMSGTWLAAQYGSYSGYVMAKFVVGTDAYGESSNPNPGANGDYYSSNSYLNLAQMTVNAQYILNYLRNRGWSKNAVCGMLGNMQSESKINPGVWEGLNPNNTNRGYGLVQWTPSTKFTNWAQQNGYQINDMVGQLERIRHEVTHGGQWYSTNAYPMSFSAFTTSTESPYYLACAFLRNYERPAQYHYEQRGNQATYWFNTLI